jgi:hypothetical protein
MREDYDSKDVSRGLAIGTMALVVTLASAFTIVNATTTVDSGAHSFIGTAPNASSVEALPPQF